MLFVEYPKCTTCQKAKKWLDDHNVVYTDRNIKEDNPTLQELKSWYSQSGLPLRRFFNTSGLLYKEYNLKEKLQTMGDEEMLQLLSTNGMLVKRPIIIKEDAILIGFKESDWEATLL